ncbi:MAG TPA: lytic transglycosylase domain-containing protein [Verrucomicrobiae bacterium]|nr:lytic transglycosylase domain-containing protein [Verrucomicrobiae bacterium]
MQVRRISLIFVVLVTALPCLAGEVAVLKNGFSIRYERREIVGNTTRLYVSADGSSFVDVPTAEIDRYEAAPDLPKNAFQTSTSKQTATSPSSTQPAGFSILPRADLSTVVNEASDRYRLDPDLVSSVIKAESGFNARAVSPKGAQGLMQLMPGTASELGVPNPFDPAANVNGGTRYLRELMERYDFDIVKALAAYNAGPQRVERYGGVPPYYETRAYVARVVKDFNKKKIAQKMAQKNSSAKARTTSKSATRSTAQHSSPSTVQARAQAN